MKSRQGQIHTGMSMSTSSDARMSKWIGRGGQLFKKWHMSCTEEGGGCGKCELRMRQRDAPDGQDDDWAWMAPQQTGTLRRQSTTVNICKLHMRFVTISNNAPCQRETTSTSVTAEHLRSCSACIIQGYLIYPCSLVF